MVRPWQTFERDVLQFIKKSFPDCKVMREVNVGRTPFGRKRRLDGVIISPCGKKALGIECKLQNSPGSREECVHYAREDAKACPLETLIVYGGDGWGDGALAFLRGNRYAIEFNGDTTMLRQAVGLHMGFLEVIEGEEVLLANYEDRAEEDG